MDDSTRAASADVDASYRPFPSFTGWLRSTRVDTRAWDDQLRSLEAVIKEANDPAIFEKAVRVAMRAAAVDTGAIEDLYTIDYGETFAIATEAEAWQAQVSAKGDDFQALLESQLRAYEFSFEAGTQGAPITESWLRQLHQVITGAQETYRVLTDNGWQNQFLPKGEYKSRPNHVRLPDGSVHAYAPVDDTATEIHRLVETMKSLQFAQAHAVNKAAFAHYALVSVHPFADGNGRVSRALASVFFYRRPSRIPLVIFASQRVPYFHSLHQADEGQYQPFVDFILECALQTLALVEEDIRSVRRKPVSDLVDTLTKALVTRRGLTQLQIDDVAYQLLDEAGKALESEIASISLPQGVTLKASVIRTSEQVVPLEDFRKPEQSDGRKLDLKLEIAKPAQVSMRRQWTLYAAATEEPRFDAVLDDLNGNRVGARRPEVWPRVQDGFTLRLRRWAGNQVSWILEQAEAELKRLKLV